MSFLIDTDICSAYLKGNPGVFARFMQYIGQLWVSAITVGELYTWALKKNAPAKRLDSLKDFLDGVGILDLDADVSRRFGEIRAWQLDQGTPIPPLDLFIAATALVHNCVLVTHNVQDFQNVPGLVIEDWLSP